MAFDLAFCSQQISLLLATCSRARAGGRQRGSTPAPSSRAQQPVRCGPDSWAHRCSPQPHTLAAVGCESENKPCLKKKTTQYPSRAQFSEPQLHSDYFSGRSARGARNQKGIQNVQQQKTHNWNCQEKPKIATGAVVMVQICAEGSRTGGRESSRGVAVVVLKKCAPALWPRLPWQQRIKHPFQQNNNRETAII